MVTEIEIECARNQLRRLENDFAAEGEPMQWRNARALFQQLESRLDYQADMIRRLCAGLIATSPEEAASVGIDAEITF